jgi:ABC-2 type transport system permease protein
MTLTLSHTRSLTVRHLRELWRQPWQVIIVLMQPVIWLLVFGSLFQRVVEIPGFGVDDYRAFLTPGVVIMTAFFGAAWSGMGLIEDLQEGVVDRMLPTPVHRGAMIAAHCAAPTPVAPTTTAATRPRTDGSGARGADTHARAATAGRCTAA